MVIWKLAQPCKNNAAAMQAAASGRLKRPWATLPRKGVGPYSPLPVPLSPFSGFASAHFPRCFPNLIRISLSSWRRISNWRRHVCRRVAFSLWNPTVDGIDGAGLGIARRGKRSRRRDFNYPLPRCRGRGIAYDIAVVPVQGRTRWQIASWILKPIPGLESPHRTIDGQRQQHPRERERRSGQITVIPHPGINR